MTVPRPVASRVTENCPCMLVIVVPVALPLTLMVCSEGLGWSMSEPERVICRLTPYATESVSVAGTSRPSSTSRRGRACRTAALPVPLFVASRRSSLNISPPFVSQRGYLPGKVRGHPMGTASHDGHQRPWGKWRLPASRGGGAPRGMGGKSDLVGEKGHENQK